VYLATAFTLFVAYIDATPRDLLQHKGKILEPKTPVGTVYNLGPHGIPLLPFSR
jgi:hypothetical protein